jgi:thiamine kinase-like enzyme
MFARQATYLATIRERGLRLPARYEEYAGAWADVRAAMAAAPRPTVPCNNDLLAANFVDDGHRTWLIDYEYAGNNDACFELGNTSAECGFTPEMTQAWTEAYFGTPTAADLARVRLQTLCSCYGWSLWGFIQAAVSPLDFDFWSWGMERFEKAQRAFADPGFPALLTAVADG